MFAIIFRISINVFRWQAIFCGDALFSRRFLCARWSCCVCVCVFEKKLMCIAISKMSHLWEGKGVGICGWERKICMLPRSEAKTPQTPRRMFLSSDWSGTGRLYIAAPAPFQLIEQFGIMPHSMMRYQISVRYSWTIRIRSKWSKLNDLHCMRRGIRWKIVVNWIDVFTLTRDVRCVIDTCTILLFSCVLRAYNTHMDQLNAASAVHHHARMLQHKFIIFVHYSHATRTAGG